MLRNAIPGVLILPGILLNIVIVNQIVDYVFSFCFDVIYGQHPITEGAVYDLLQANCNDFYPFEKIRIRIEVDGAKICIRIGLMRKCLR